MTKDKIKEIEELCEGATSGPWVLEHKKMKHFKNDILADCEYCDEEPFVLAQLNRHMENWNSDAKFIAASRTIIPELLEERTLLLEVIEIMSKRLEVIAKNDHTPTLYCIEVNEALTKTKTMLEGAGV